MKITQTYFCAVCGKAVDPKKDIVMSLGSRALFPVHAGKCRENVATGVVAIRDFVEARYPKVGLLRKILTDVLVAVNENSVNTGNYTKRKAGNRNGNT